MIYVNVKLVINVKIKCTVFDPNEINYILSKYSKYRSKYFNNQNEQNLNSNEFFPLYYYLKFKYTPIDLIELIYSRKVIL